MVSGLMKLQEFLLARAYGLIDVDDLLIRIVEPEDLRYRSLDRKEGLCMLSPTEN